MNHPRSRTARLNWLIGACASLIAIGFATSYGASVTVFTIATVFALWYTAREIGVSQ